MHRIVGGGAGWRELLLQFAVKESFMLFFVVRLER